MGRNPQNESVSSSWSRRLLKEQRRRVVSVQLQQRDPTPPRMCPGASARRLPPGRRPRWTDPGFKAGRLPEADVTTPEENTALCCSPEDGGPPPKQLTKSDTRLQKRRHIHSVALATRCEESSCGAKSAGLASWTVVGKPVCGTLGDGGRLVQRTISVPRRQIYLKKTPRIQSGGCLSNQTRFIWKNLISI